MSYSGGSTKATSKPCSRFVVSQLSIKLASCRDQRPVFFLVFGNSPLCVCVLLSGLSSEALRETKALGFPPHLCWANTIVSLEASSSQCGCHSSMSRVWSREGGGHVPFGSVALFSGVPLSREFAGLRRETPSKELRKDFERGCGLEVYEARRASEPRALPKRRPIFLWTL